MRLQKFMADAGIASRRKCEEYIAEGRVKVNGNTAVIGCTVEDGDEVLFDGNPVCGKTARVAIVLNKPQGVVCTSSDPEGRRTVVDYVKELPYRLYNVGRLDYDSEGLIILTNDGDLAYKMMHPKFTVEKTYHVVCTGSLTGSDKERLEKGVALEDGLTAPAKIENIEYSQGRTAFDITIHEGRNRQVRRMLSAVGREVMLLRRIKEGSITLGGLKGGQWRYLTEGELDSLMREQYHQLTRAHTP